MSDVSRLQEAGYAVRPLADVNAEALAAANDAARDVLIRAQKAEARVAELEAALVESAGFRVEYEDLDDIEQDDYDEHCAKVRALVGHLAP